MRYILLENYPADSRVKILEDDVCQTLSSWMGTGGGNVPMVIEVEDAKDTDNPGGSGGGRSSDGTRKK